jgi:hypothetical protein
MNLNHLKYFAGFLVLVLLGIPALAQSLYNFSTDLPLIIIDTDGKNIPDEPKITARMKIINNSSGVNRINDQANVYDGFIGIEGRGTSSIHYPQTPYAVETRNADGSNRNISLLGLPKENDWVLLSNYNDKSFMRNILGYRLFGLLGHYAPRARLVEVILNNEYRGIYVFGEKIKRDNDRVDIATLKEDDNSGEEVTGGYIFKIDYYTGYDSWLSPFSPMNHPNFDVHFVYHDPKWDELTVQQKNYIKGYVTDFETILYSSNYNNPVIGYSYYIDVQSFIDYFIVSEISRNNDGFKKSRYFHKDKNGKINAGPVWDFDWAWKNINECYIFKATDGSGWAYKVNNCNPWVKSPGWMSRLFYDDEFKNMTNCRYFEMRASVLSDERIFGIIDSLQNVVKNAQQRHFEKWDILGINVGAPEIGEQPLTYEGEVEKLKNWITTRLNWLDNNMIGECATSGFEGIAENNSFKIYPNPATTQLNILTGQPVSDLRVLDLTGKTVLSQSGLNSELIHLDVSALTPGIYLLKITDIQGNSTTEKVIVNR